MTRSIASRSTASRAVAVLFLGAALSSGVLAAPTRSPMIPSSIGVRDLQSQSSSDGQGTLPEGRIRELTTVQRSVSRHNGDGLTIDDLEHGRSDPGNVSVAVKLNIRGDEKGQKEAEKGVAKEADLVQFEVAWNSDLTCEDDRKKRVLLLNLIKREGFKIKNLFDLFDPGKGLVANDPELTALKSSARKMWVKIADWIRKELAIANGNTIEPRLDAILHNRPSGSTEREEAFVEFRSKLDWNDKDEIEWMVDLSKVALKLQLCHEEIADRYASLLVYRTVQVEGQKSFT
ncbi:hypothetical protein C8R42DRAFT_724808 [Lentinula raphanica]|nr:hypothetical protein C8R42DRAFT_724808 [Lentinula raphanica]